MNKTTTTSIVFCLFFTTIALQAQVTFTNTVADIVYNKCASCHRQGEIAPFGLTNYEEVVNYGAMIKYVTTNKIMPPWKADPTYQHYREENYLTSEEIAKIAEWVDNEMPFGIESEEPAFPDYPSGSALGIPDKVVTFAQKHIHKGNNKDEYWYYAIPTELTENKIIKAVEVRPGNKKIVHHALLFQDTLGKVRGIDEKTAGYGFSANNPEFNVDQVLFQDQYPGYVPGQKAIRFPETLGQKMKKGSDLVLQVHYAPTPVDEVDSTSVNLFFADENEEIERLVTSKIMLPTELPGGFFSFVMPANQKKTFVGRWKVPVDASFVGIMPHCHLLGKRWKVWLERPDGTKENFVKIDDWDFNWQGGYWFNKFIFAPKNSSIVAEAEYDNTTANPNNPNNPPKVITWGENTSDEMYYLPLLYVPYKAGDENVVFDVSTSTNDDIQTSEINIDNINLSPNPSMNQWVNVGFNIRQGQTLNILVLNKEGKKVKSISEKEFFAKGNHVVHFDPNNLHSGQYFVMIEGTDFVLSESVMVVK